MEALRKGGNLPCILNAANEVAVEAFLKDAIGFLDIAEIIDKTMNTIEFMSHPSIEDYIECDRIARKLAYNFVVKKS